jgi:hypothetical protein
MGLTIEEVEINRTGRTTKVSYFRTVDGWFRYFSTCCETVSTKTVQTTNDMNYSNYQIVKMMENKWLENKVKVL